MLTVIQDFQKNYFLNHFGAPDPKPRIIYHLFGKDESAMTLITFYGAFLMYSTNSSKNLFSSHNYFKRGAQ